MREKNPSYYRGETFKLAKEMIRDPGQKQELIGRSDDTLLDGIFNTNSDDNHLLNIYKTPTKKHPELEPFIPVVG